MGIMRRAALERMTDGFGSCAICDGNSIGTSGGFIHARGQGNIGIKLVLTVTLDYEGEPLT